MELQKLFNSMLLEGQTKVVRRDLVVGILNVPELIGVLSQKQCDELIKAIDERIDWLEFLDFIQACEGNENNLDNIKNKNSRAVEEDMTEEDFSVYGELVEQQSKALKIDFQGEIPKIVLMDSDDIRVQMSYNNKLIVNSNSDALNIAMEYITKKSYNEDMIPLLMDHIERAIIKSCQQEIKLLDHETNLCLQQMESMADMLLSVEEKMLKYLDDYKRMEFMTQMSTVARRGSVQQDIQLARSDENQLTPGQLARKLSELHLRTKEKTEEVCNCQVKPCVL
jgi:hypothetical protein